MKDILNIGIDFDGTCTEEDKNPHSRTFQPFRQGFLDFCPKIAELPNINLMIITARNKPEYIEDVKRRLSEIDYLKYFSEVTNLKRIAYFYFDDKSTIIDWESLYETLKDRPVDDSISFDMSIVERYLKNIIQKGKVK